MAGGQSLTSGQGSVVQGGDVPLAGLALAGSTGFFDFPVLQAIAGEEATGQQASKPDYFHTHFIRLRSRKAGGGGTAQNQLFGEGLLQTQGTTLPVVAAFGTTQVATLAQGAYALTRSKLLGGLQIGSGTGLMTGNGSTPTVWAVGNFSLTVGQTGQSSGQFSVSNTGPSAYIGGGTYDAVGGTALPTGVTLSPDGLVDVGTAAAATATGVVFGYTEPLAIPDITIYSGSVAGVLPYFGAVYPCEGACPTGATLRSPEDPSLRSTVTSTWPDGSAQVAVFAGHYNLGANSQTTISLQPTTAADVLPLTAAFINTLMTSVSFASTSGVPASSFSAWTAPEWVWWANSQLICARYRTPLGLGVMDAVIDVHAFANGRAFVEVVIENSRMTIPTYPTTIPDIADQAYVGMTVLINGVQAGPAVSSSQVQQHAIHQRTRAWYCSGWVGGDPLTSITHDTNALQAHPMFWKRATPVTSNFNSSTLTGLNNWSATSVILTQPYASDVYSPWCTGRGPLRNEQGTGETSRGFVGLLNGWEIDYLMTGDKRPANSVIQNGYTFLSRHLNWRDAATGACLITSAQLQGRQQIFDLSPVNPAVGSSSFIPSVYHNTPDSNAYANFELSHQPAAPIIPFMLRPSPVFIEICQKIAVFNHTFGTTTGRWNQRSTAWRGRAWGGRNMGLACFITPDTQTGSSAWKAGMRTVLATNADEATFYGTIPSIAAFNTLDVLFDYATGSFDGTETASSIDNDSVDSDKGRLRGYQAALWFQYFTIQGWQMVSAAKVMRVASEITRWETGLSYACRLPVRYINECTNGEWRMQPYVCTIGDFFDASPGPKRIQMASDWQTSINNSMTGTVADAPAGVWLFNDFYDPAIKTRTWAQSSNAMAHGVGYNERFWGALVFAKERGEPGAESAYATVAAGITGFNTWLSSWGDAPIYNRLPRNL